MRVFKRITKAASFLAVCLVCLTFVSATSGEPMDIVVLFDMSRGGGAGESGEFDTGKSYNSLAHFEETRDYISGAFLKEFVRKGDTFHLISFGDTPRIELSRRIEGEGDYRTIIGRLLLLYPLAQSSSLENAAAYTQAFIAELPPARQKKVVLFTAQSGITAAELGARFRFEPANENTTLYLAAIPASLGTLVSGRTMLKAPPKITPPVIAARPPVSPPVPISENVERTEPAPPVIEAVPESPPDITAAPASPDSRLIWDSRDEPVPFDKFKVLMIILPLAGMILLFALGLGCVVTWKKRDHANTYTFDDYLYRINGYDAPETPEDDAHYVIPVQGLLQKASEAREQLA